MSTTSAAAYGLRLDGLSDDRWLEVTSADHWPLVVVSPEPSRTAEEVSLDREALRLHIRSDVPHTELVHPLLGRVASELALARGDDAMHSGAIVGAEGAWCLIGPKGHGKSTLIAALAAKGIPVLTDDVLVFSNGTAKAGPRCVDLRPGADRYGASAPVRPDDPRRRITLPPINAEYLMAGVIHLEWSAEELSLRSLGHRAALERMLSLRSEKGFPSDFGKLLDLAALPTHLLRRPNSWSEMPACVYLVAQLIGEDTPAEAGTRMIEPAEL